MGHNIKAHQLSVNHFDESLSTFEYILHNFYSALRKNRVAYFCVNAILKESSRWKEKIRWKDSLLIRYYNYERNKNTTEVYDLTV